MAQPAHLIIETLARHRAEIERNPERHERLQALQRFQVERLRRTYADCASKPRYRAALEFFVTDLYGPHDHTGRDRGLRKVLDPWTRLLTARSQQALSRALELELLTHALDVAMVDALHGAAPSLKTYPEAYRRADRYEDRQRQIDLILAVGRHLAALSDIPALGMALSVASVPARILGVMELHLFLERGYQAFKRMGRANELLQIIEQRETDIMRRLIEGIPNPFRMHGSHKTAPR